MPGLTALPLIAISLLASQTAVPQERQVSVKAPTAVLTGLDFSVELEMTSGPPGAFILETADGRLLGGGDLVAGQSVTVEGLTISSASEVPVQLSWTDGGQATEVRPRVLPGWMSLLPPLVAIALALIFKEVIISLFAGVWLGALAYAGLNPIGAMARSVDRFIAPAIADGSHAAILVFSFLLGGMVGVISRSGGTHGIVQAVRPLARTRRRAQLATYLGGLAIFFDDYANTLVIGNTMRPITDRMKVSREKLAYIVDSTAAPVAAIMFVSTWAGFEISLIGDGLRAAAADPGTSPAIAAGLEAANPFAVFIHTIPYLFYPILALFMVGLVVITRRDFGPMLTAERRAARGDGVYREGAALLADTSSEALEPAEGVPLRWYNAVLPVLTVIFVVFAGLYTSGLSALGRPGTLSEVFGQSDPFASLLWGSLSGLFVAIIMAVAQRILTAKQAVDACVGGMRSMFLAAIILTLAWALGGVTEALGTGPYISTLIQDSLPPQMLPAMVFLAAAATAFATGTSWGTMAIFVPIVIPLAIAFGGAVGFEHGAQYGLLLGSTASVLAGAIFGDHCSPISDTTVLSSMASACDHMDHVRTQLPYALAVATLAVLAGSISVGYGLHPAFAYLIGTIALFLLLRFVGKRDEPLG
ncbi:MAG: Na+/H+ antiporter NhaC family protein [Gemmatimonadota bacterium]